jgi:hypothetical protein
VSPSQGPVDGGTAVVVGGSNFQSGASVSFGGIQASSVVYVNSATLNVTTPAHAAGAVDVAVTNPNGRTGTLAQSFTYNDTTSSGVGSGGGTTPPPATGALEDEFVGPLASWKNIKTVYGAKGDGVSDDTAAIRNALNAMQDSVIYVPAGTYNISSTIAINLTNNSINAQIVGADPATTIFKWTGASGGTMFQIGGFSFSKVGRITFDGAGKAGTLWYGDSGNVEGTSQRGTQLMFFDDVFQNAGKGLIQGMTGSSSQDSEWVVLRCQFLNDSQAGASLESWNAGDFWFYSSTFKNCGYGIANGVWGGPMSFAVYGSNFFGSTIADISTVPMVMTIKDNYSSGSNQFLYDDSSGNNATEMYIQGNRILDTKNPIAIQSTGCGPIVMVDNVIRSKSGAAGPAVQVQTGCFSTGGAAIFSVGNKYTVSNPESAQGTTPRVYSIEGSSVTYASIDGTAPTLPGTPPNLGRTITEIPAGSTASQIQTAINNVVSRAGQRPVIHLQGGSYSIASTITVPANLDVQIIGDGFNTKLNWTGSSGGTLFKLASPSKARLQDMYLRGNTTGDPLYVGSEDVSGSRVQAEMIISTNSTGPNGLLVEGLTNTMVNFYGTSIQSGSTSVHSVVGTGVAGVPSRVACFGCGEGAANAASSSSDFYHVSNQGNLVVFSGWLEESGGQGGIITNLVNASGNLSLLGGVAAPNISSGQPTVNLDNFQGTFTLASYDVRIGQMNIANASSATNALLVGSRTVSGAWAGPYSGSGTEAMVGNFQQTSSGASLYADQAQGTSLPLSAAYVDKMFAQARKTATTPNTALPSGVSDVQLSFLGIDGGSKTALHIKAGP